MYDCSIIACKDYEEKSVKAALTKAILDIDGLSFIKKGMLIAIKPNLVSFKKPESAATTHPMLLKALTEIIIERGASVVIGDCPGGPHTTAYLNKVYSSTGMFEVEKCGAKLNRDLEQITEKIENGKALKELTYAAFLKNADAIIDFCKLKSHGLMGMSAAVKNLYGVVPGLLKPQMHYQFPNEADFAEMLIDINEFIKPSLSIMDAVIGMEGNGPLNGTPREVGAIVASKSQYVCDLVGAKLIGLDPSGVPTIVKAHERGLAPIDVSDLKISGNIDDFIVSDYKAPPVRGLRFMQKGTLRGTITAKALAQKPALRPKLCVGCSECAKICPAKAIEMKNKKPVINRKECIRCFCCQEFCPKAAMIVRRPLAARVMNKLKL
ncbi:MAG: DUF362 domain-containing protein [Clostridia bacterium]|nr:DUF362 domain-containing protein [Clostridia bacterium]